MALSKTTQDHDEIKAWAEERGGKPAEVASTETKDGPGILRLEFPGAVHANDSNLKEISWDDFFAKFDESGLALVYQDVTADGERSNFNRLIHPENASGASASAPAAKSTKKSGASPGKRTSIKAAAKKATPKKSAVKPPSPGKKAAGTKTASPATKKTGAKTKPVEKKAPAKTTKKAAAPAKKLPIKAVAAKKAAAKEAPAKKASATKAGAKKAPAKKAAAKKPARR